MFDSTLELFTQAASNSLFIFCFCNLIIVVILVGSKPVNSLNQENEIPLSTSTHTIAYANVKQVTMKDHSFDGSKETTSTDTMELPNVREAPTGNVGEDNSDNEKFVEKEDDDELTRRVEAFIDKVNREWRAELQRTSHFV